MDRVTRVLDLIEQAHGVRLSVIIEPERPVYQSYCSQEKNAIILGLKGEHLYLEFLLAHECRHFIQSILGMTFTPVANIRSLPYVEYIQLPWEVDANKFAYAFCKSNKFNIPVHHFAAVKGYFQ